jgi:arylformamidase
MKLLYGGFATQEDLDREYNVEKSVPDFGIYVTHFLSNSAAARESTPHTADVPYGPTKAETANIFPAANPGSPVLVFVHGGYWKALTAHVFDMVAPGPVAAGYAVVNVTYALCPAVTITEIVRQVRAAIAWTFRHAASFNGDPNRIYLAGHSAGGHLTAMAVLTEWAEEYGLPEDVVKAAMPISGLFDLSPFPMSFIQPQLRLSAEEVQRVSPILHIRTSAVPLVVAWGAAETNEFQRQSKDFLTAWQATGNAGEALAIPEANHFEVLDGFMTADGLMTRRLDALRQRVEAG